MTPEPPILRGDDMIRLVRDFGERMADEVARSYAGAAAGEGLARSPVRSPMAGQRLGRFVEEVLAAWDEVVATMREPGDRPSIPARPIVIGPIAPGGEAAVMVPIHNHTGSRRHVELSATHLLTSSDVSGPAPEVLLTPTLTVAPEPGHEVEVQVCVPSGTPPAEYVGLLLAHWGDGVSTAEVRVNVVDAR